MLKMEKTDKSPRFKSNPRYSKLGLAKRLIAFDLDKEVEVFIPLKRDNNDSVSS